MLSIRVEEQPGGAAAQWLAERIGAAVEARGRCTLALSGGRTPWSMLAVLAERDLPWAGLWILQSDERIAPDGDPVRNWTHIQAALGGKVPADQLVPMPVTAQPPEKGTAQYEDTLHRVAGYPPVLDILHLGLGADGHTASLLPGSPLLEESRRNVAVTEPYQGHRRMTLTLPVLRSARSVLWLVSGGDKAEPLARLAAGDRGIPSGLVRHDRAVVFADPEAASLCAAAENAGASPAREG